MWLLPQRTWSRHILRKNEKSDGDHCLLWIVGTRKEPKGGSKGRGRTISSALSRKRSLFFWYAGEREWEKKRRRGGAFRSSSITMKAKTKRRGETQKHTTIK